MKTNYKYLFILAGIAAMAAACHREEEFDEKGHEVNFNITTGYENSPATRTEYSGERYTVGSASYERIDWTFGDVIRIASDKAVTSDGAFHQDYTIQSASPGNEKSYAMVSSLNPLIWGTGTNTFYGLYPAPGTDGVDSGVSFTDTGIATLVLPADQSAVTMKYAYMGAAIATSERSSVSLNFKPLVNVFCFKLLGDKDDWETIPLKSLTLTSADSYLSAPSYTVALDASDNSFGNVTYTESTASKSITIDYSNSSYKYLYSDTPFTCTLFALPEYQTNFSLTLTFRSGAGTDITKSFDLTGLSILPGQKVNISSTINLPSYWDY